MKDLKFTIIALFVIVSCLMGKAQVTEARAKQFGIKFRELSDIFRKGMNVDYLALESTGNLIRRVLEAGNGIHITHPNGTDLKVTVTGRKIIVLDGIVSDEDLKEGFLGTQVYLPASEAAMSPVPGSKLACWTPAGMITIRIGNNLFAGGDNKSAFGYSFHIPGCTLTVDGKIVVNGGILSELSGFGPPVEIISSFDNSGSEPAASRFAERYLDSLAGQSESDRKSSIH